MANDIQKIIVSNDIKNGTIVVSTKPTGPTAKDKNNTYISNPVIADIEAKYDDRFDDPTYYGKKLASSPPGPTFTSTYTTTGDGAAAGSPMRATGNYGATDPVFTVATGFSGNITVTANVSGGSSDYERNLKVLKNGSVAATLFDTDSWGGTYSATITVAAGDTIGFLRSTFFITVTYVEVQFQ